MEDLKHDFDLVPKANTLLTKFDMFVLTSVFLIIFICIAYMIIGLFNPSYFFLCR